MNRLLCSLIVKNKNLLQLNYKTTTNIPLSFNRFLKTENNDSFGVGSKYADLDSVKLDKTEFAKYEDRRAQQLIPNRPIKLKNDQDTFGTLTNQLDDIEFKTSISHSKPMEDGLKEDDEYEKKYDKILNHIRLSNDKDRANTEKFYANKINELVNMGKLKEAIDVFFLEMIEKDRYKPTLWLYKTLMRALAQHGYTHMAFSLFKKLTSSKDDDWNETLNITKLHQIITLLFQSCANSPWPEYAIRKTDSVRFYLKNRQITPNVKNYSAMILAYGKAGAIYEAFNVVDELIQNRIKPDLSIFSNLLCACISQPNYGFRYALMAWQMCLKFRVVPDLTMYNLLLRAANDCNISLKKDRVYLGSVKDKRDKSIISENENKNLFPVNCEEHKLFFDEDYQILVNQQQYTQSDEHLSNTMGEISKLNQCTLKKIENSKDLIDGSSNVLELSPKDVHVIDEFRVVGRSLESQIRNLEWWQDIKTNVDKTELLKGLANFKPEIKEVIMAQSYESLLTRVNSSIEKEVFDFVTSDQDTPEGHLSMLGSANGVFRSMTSHQVTPDFKTFNIMTQLLPNDLESENQLIAKMKKYNVTPDIDFINLLLRRRIRRNEYYDATVAFKMIQENQLAPNIMTFGCLALKIDKLNLLTEFLKDLKDMNFKLNPIITSTLYSKGRFRKDLPYLEYLFHYIIENNVKIDEKLKGKIDSDLEKMRNNLISIEKKGGLDQKGEFEYKNLRYFYSEFKPMYQEWLERVKFEKKAHPYAKFGRSDDKLFNSILQSTQKLKQAEKK